MHLAGSSISSNNLVVVSYVDDLMGTGAAADNGGDQLIPIKGLGTDYVQIRTNLSVPERVFFTGIYDGTILKVFDGTNTTTLILNKGKLASYALPAGANAAYIHSDKAISVYQLGGSGGELGSGILTPVVDCKGTDIVAFQRPTSASTTFFNLIVPTGHEGDFLLNGSSTIITAADFLQVPGYPGWKYCRKDVTSNFAAGQTILVRNTSSKFFFYQNVYSAISGGGGGDFSNFSDFGNILANPKVTRNCANGIVTLDSRSLAYNASIINYIWTGPAGNTLASGNNIPQYTLNSVTPADTGWYRVQIFGDNGCSITDSMHVNLPVLSVTLDQKPLTACAGSSVLFASSATPGAKIDSIRWTGPNSFINNMAGFNIQNAKSSDAGTYVCRYYDSYGCYVETNASLVVNTASSIPEFSINGNDLLTCSQSSTTLSVAGYTSGLAYRTFTGYTAPSLLASSNFNTVTTGFYNQQPATSGTATQFNLGGLTGIPAGTKNFGVKYRGFIQIVNAGSYTFYLNSYDGSNLYIDGAQVVSNDGTHVAMEVSNSVMLSAGYHPVEVNYFTGNGPASLTVSWQGPSIAKAAIPASALFMPGGTAPVGMTYTWIDESTGNNVGSGSSFITSTKGVYRLVASNGCESFRTFQVDQSSVHDYSDLPATWPLAQAGTAGCISPAGVPLASNAVWAGNGVSAEQTHNTNVDADSYDDGLSNSSAKLTIGAPTTFGVALNSNTAGKTVYYGLWFDWNNNSNFTDDYETPGGSRSFYAGSGIVAAAGTAVVQNVTVRVPANASPDYKTRLIVSDIPIGFTDFGKIYAMGEVEDYGTRIPLPVVMQDFKAVKVKEGVQLQWNVGVEDNVSHYSIEWSADGRKFGSIGRRNATGSNQYEYLHTSPLNGFNYYRIRIIDNDGSSAYSIIRIVQTGNNNAGQFFVSPTPLRADKRVKLTIAGIFRTEASVLITDQFGRQVHTSRILVQEGLNESFIQLQHLAAGIYYLKLYTGNGEFNALPAQKIVIPE